MPGCSELSEEGGDECWRQRRIPGANLLWGDKL